MVCAASATTPEHAAVLSLCSCWILLPSSPDSGGSFWLPQLPDLARLPHIHHCRTHISRVYGQVAEMGQGASREWCLGTRQEGRARAEIARW